MFRSLMDYWRRRQSRKQLERLGSIPVPADPDPGIPWDRSKSLAAVIIALLWSVSSLLLTLAQKDPQNNNYLLRLLDQNDLRISALPAPKTINAGFDFSYPDVFAAKLAKQEARQQEPKFFSISGTAQTELKERISRFFNAVRDYPASGGNPQSAIAAALPENVRASFAECSRNAAARRDFDNTLAEVLHTGIISEQDLARLSKNAKVKVMDLHRRIRMPRPISGICTRQTAALKLADAVMRFQASVPDFSERNTAVAAVFARLIGPDGTLKYEAKLSADAARDAAAEVKTVVTEYRKNQMLVRKNEIIDPAKRELLKFYFGEKDRRERPDEQWQYLVRNMFWSMIMVLMGGFYLYHLHRNVLQGNRNLALLAGIMILALAAEYWGILIFRHFRENDLLMPELVADAVPVGLAAVLLAPVMGFRVGLCAGFFSASAAALMLDMPFEYALKGIVISLLCALAVRQATNYRAYFLWIFFSVTPLVWLLNSDLLGRIRNGDVSLDLFEQTCSLALLNGLATGMLALLIIFILELGFHISTNMSLMLLCDYNHPLLEKMKRKAPGTFFHSLTVATLAEDAARSIDANYLQAKVGALFHDIGKLEKPQYFTENNQNTANLHTALTPQMSSIIIRDHVKDGLAMAKKHKLGQVVNAAIAQHHGTDLVHFFYRAAQENAKRTGETVNEDMFRYPGPRPQSKETAIISLADVCEAASRSMEKTTPEELETLVSRIFEQRFKDGQLGEANVTLAELEKIRESFVNTLLSMKHGRIAYRDEDDDEHGDPLPMDPFRRNAAEESGGPAGGEKTDPAGR